MSKGRTGFIYTFWLVLIFFFYHLYILSLHLRYKSMFKKAYKMQTVIESKIRWHIIHHQMSVIGSEHHRSSREKELTR